MIDLEDVAASLAMLRLGAKWVAHPSICIVATLCFRHHVLATISLPSHSDATVVDALYDVVLFDDIRPTQLRSYSRLTNARRHSVAMLRGYISDGALSLTGPVPTLRGVELECGCTP